MHGKYLDKLDKAIELGACALKAGTEHEGNTRPEIFTFSQIAQLRGLPFWLKIGGCEARTDFDFYSKGVPTAVPPIYNFIAPMVESEYASQKFIDLCNINGIKKCINIETWQSLAHVKNRLIDLSKYNRVNIGRSDLSESLDGYNIPLGVIYDFVRDNYSGILTFGGGVAPNGWHDDIHKYDGFFTRHVMFDKTNNELYPGQVKAALEFEISFYEAMQDRQNICDLLKKRLTL